MFNRMETDEAASCQPKETPVSGKKNVTNCDHVAMGGCKQVYMWIGLQSTQNAVTWPQGGHPNLETEL